MLPIIAPTLAAAASVGIGSAWLFRAEIERRQFIESAFRHFLAPSYIERLIAEPQLLRVGGERRELTFLFTDVTGFTTLTERTDPESFVPMLNGYLDGICRIVLDHGGTIDKIVGDAVHAFFGAPVPEPDHAARAVRCALDLAAFGDDFVRRQADLGREFGATRVGVQTGPVILGNFGGAGRWDYTAYGDAVNVAVRLEAANSAIGTRICIGGETAAQCPRMRFRLIGRVRLKGKINEVEALEPMPDDANSGDIDAYSSAYDLMAKGDRAAEKAFADLARQWPHDKLVAFHLARCSAGEVSSTISLDHK
jgi:adenylate cyclase